MPLRIRFSNCLILPVIAFACGGAAAATRYQLDTTFAAPVLTQPATGQIGALPLADGGVLVAGGFNWAGGQTPGPWVRLNADGTVQNANWPAPSSPIGGAQICQLADGRILAASPSSSGGNGAGLLTVSGSPATILRFELSGAKDDGYAVTLGAPPGSAASVSGLWAFPGGRIFVTGHFISAGGHATRDVAALFADGTIDFSYTSLTDFSGPVAVGADGALLGVVQPPSSLSSAGLPVVERLDPGGSVTDTWILPISAASSVPSALAIAADGSGLVGLDDLASGAIIGIVDFSTASRPPAAPRAVLTTPLVFRLPRGNPTPAAFFSTPTLPASVSKIQVQADGGVLLVGQLPQTSSVQPSGLLRLNPDGTPDLLFSAPTLAGESVVSLQPLAGGWLAVLNSAAGAAPADILRKLDANFGLRTDFLADLRQTTPPSAVWPLPDGSLLLQGNFENAAGNAQRFVRLRSDGTLDYDRVPLAPETQAASVAAVDAAGRIYLTGASLTGVLTVPVTFTTVLATDSLSSASTLVFPSPEAGNAGGLTPAQLERFSIDGARDLAFGQPSLPGATDRILAVQVDAQNRILVLGVTTTVSIQSRLARFTSAGASDPNFNNLLAVFPLGRQQAAAVSAEPGGGYLLADTSGNLYALNDDGSAASPLPICFVPNLQQLAPAAGAVFAAGSFSAVVGNPSPAIARLLPAGTPDPTWRSELNPESVVSAVQSLPDGRIVIGGFLGIPGQPGMGNAILTATGAWDANESLPPSLQMAVAADGSLFGFNGDGSVQRLVAVNRPDLSLALSAPAYSAGDSVRIDAISAGSTAGAVVWTHNGAVVPGMSGPELTLAAAAAADAGWYTAEVTTPVGPVYATAYVAVTAIGARLANASVRAFVGSGDAAQTVGFVVSGISSEPALLRVTDDGLAQFGVTDYCTNPASSLYIGGVLLLPEVYSGTYPAYKGTDTLANAALLGGAFPVAESNADPQELMTPQPGVAYTLQRSAPAAQSGISLFELYLPETSASLASGRRLVNFSARAAVGQGDQLFVVGFVVSGNAPLPVLVRGLGPALGRFGVSDAVGQPVLTVYGGPTVVASNAGWQNQASATQVAAAAAKAGAFALAPGADSALLLTLPPGAYTAVLQSGGPGGSVGMIELYDASD